MTVQSFAVRPARAEDLPEIQTLLQTAKLPYDDVLPHLESFLIAAAKSRVVGCAGMELYGDYALFRSLAVQPDYRNAGVGRQLTERTLQMAGSLGVKDIFLLTNDAVEYFWKQGFAQVNRENAPDSIRDTLQFRALCPSSAVLMQKTL